MENMVLFDESMGCSASRRVCQISWRDGREITRKREITFVRFLVLPFIVFVTRSV